MTVRHEDVPLDFIERTEFLGIDQSLRKSGLCFITSDRQMIACTMSPPDDLDPVARLVWLAERYRWLASLPRLRVAAMEGYSFGSKFHLPQLGELGGIVRVALYEARVPSILVAPTSVKLYATGNGSAKKAQVKAAVSALYGIKKPSEDEADATVLAAMAQTREVPSVLPEHCRRALDSVSWLYPKRPVSVARVRTRPKNLQPSANCR